MAALTAVITIGVDPTIELGPVALALHGLWCGPPADHRRTRGRRAEHLAATGVLHADEQDRARPS